MSKLSDRIGQFVTVPNTVIEMWPTIGLDAMALFVYLRYRTNGQTEVAFPGYDKIRQDTTLTRNRIAEAIRKLEAAGLVDRKKRFGESTIYMLKLPDPPSSTAVGLLPVVQTPDDSSTAVGRSLVQLSHANQIDLNQIDLNQKKGIPHPDFYQAISILSEQHPAEYQAARPSLVRSDDKPYRLLIHVETLPAGFTDLLQAALFAANPRRNYRIEFTIPTTAYQTEDQPAVVKPALADDHQPYDEAHLSVTDYQRDTWDQIVSEICLELQPATIRTCVNPNQLVSVNGKWTVAVPDAAWWSNKANQTVKRLYRAMTGEVAEFEYIEVK